MELKFNPCDFNFPEIREVCPPKYSGVVVIPPSQTFLDIDPSPNLAFPDIDPSPIKREEHNWTIK